MQLTFVNDMGQSFVVEIDPNMELENVTALLEVDVGALVHATSFTQQFITALSLVWYTAIGTDTGLRGAPVNGRKSDDAAAGRRGQRYAVGEQTADATAAAATASDGRRVRFYRLSWIYI